MCDLSAFRLRLLFGSSGTRSEAALEVASNRVHPDISMIVDMSWVPWVHEPPSRTPRRQAIPAQPSRAATTAASLAHGHGARGAMVSCRIGHHPPGHARVLVAARAMCERAKGGARRTTIHRLLSFEGPQEIGSRAPASRGSLEVLQPPGRDIELHDRIYADCEPRSARGDLSALLLPVIAGLD